MKVEEDKTSTASLPDLVSVEDALSPKESMLYPKEIYTGGPKSDLTELFFLLDADKDGRVSVDDVVISFLKLHFL